MTRTTLLALLAPLALVACKKSVDTKGYEKKLTSELEALGITAEKVECPKNASAEKGKSFVCKITIGGKTYDFEATVKGGDGDRVDMDTRWVDGKGIVSHKVETGVGAELTKAWGVDTKLDCGDRLRFLDANSQLTCKATAEDVSVDLTLDFDANLVATKWTAKPEPVGTAKLVELLGKSVQEKLGANVTVTCGEKKLLLVPADGVVMCEASDGTKAAKLQVQFAPGTTNLQGWEVVP